MLVTAITFLNYGLILIYGTLLSIDISGGWTSKKEKMLTWVVVILLLAIQTACYFFSGKDLSERLYPLITHIPLILCLCFFFKRRISVSCVSVFMAYLCCQIPNWVGMFVLYLSDSKLLSESFYMLTVFVSFVLLHIFLVKPAFDAINYSKRSLLFLGILPVLYYIFDYVTTIYTQILYAGIPAVSEFIPTVTVLFYVFLVSLYHREIKHKYSLELENSVLTKQLKQSDAELAVLQRSLEETAAYRHDMRHHFMILGEYLKAGETDKAMEYVFSAETDIDRLTPKVYCKNKPVNLILSYYGTFAEKSGICYDVNVSIPETLNLSETELCTLLSNGIENAIHAASRCADGNRRIEIDFRTHKNTLLISIQNSYIDEIVMENGLPVNEDPNHGLGGKSISNIAERPNGMYSFEAADGIFTMRVILRQY